MPVFLGCNDFSKLLIQEPSWSKIPCLHQLLVGQLLEITSPRLLVWKEYVDSDPETASVVCVLASAIFPVIPLDLV